MKAILSLTFTLVIATGSAIALRQSSSALSGHYLEVRSCDVYTGPCFANAEVGLAGKEGILVWSFEQGSWEGANLAGLSVIAVIKTDDTLGDVRYEPRQGEAVIITDSRATPDQQRALIDFAQTKSGPLCSTLTAVQTASIESSLGVCKNSGCASVQADDIVEITTRCFGDEDHVCGNEETYYPPLTELTTATAAFTELAAFRGTQLNLTWESRGQRGAFIGTFSE